MLLAVSPPSVSVAVAVKAMMGTSSICANMVLSLRYSGRKSWPHSDMQCASSIVRQSTRTEESGGTEPDRVITLIAR